MQKTKIEWCDYSWNPIKGLCPVGCWYCYARTTYRRFGWDEKITYDYRPLEHYGKIKSGSRVFVCSTFELFNERVDHFRDSIFSTIKSRPDLTFIILTKMTERIDRPMPDNVWLGVSVTGNSMRDIFLTEELTKAHAHIKFISFEPILALPWLSSLPLRPDWIIAGRLTGHGKIHDPSRRIIEAIVEHGQFHNIPIFLKNNLKDIWGKPLIQEFPK